MTAADLLTQVEAAIAAVLAGKAIQRYTLAGISVEYSNLKELRDLRNELKREIARGNRAPIQYGDVRGR